jgi:hypothetical protein
VLPGVGGLWLLFVLGSSAYLLHREFYANAIRRLWCSGDCPHQIHPPASVLGAGLGVLALGLFTAMIAVPNAGRLRWARWGMLAGLVAASWSAETMLFAPFFG